MNIMFAALLGGWEIVLILAVVLILFGAKKLPELAKGLGFWCNGHRAEIDGADVRRAALAHGLQFS